MILCRQACIAVFSLAFFTIISVSTSNATSSGITRRSTLLSGGCGPAGCHAASPSSITTVKISEAPENTLTAAKGQKIRLTLVVQNQTKNAVGCNISVKTTLNGSSNAGALTAVAGEGLRVSVGELTHNAPKPFADSKASFAFDWTAPDTDGTYFLHAVANAINSNGSSDPNDVWNFLTPVQLIVSGTNGIDEEVASGRSTIAPQPAHESVRISAQVYGEGQYVLSIFDPLGEILRSEEIPTFSGIVEYHWQGNDKNGIPVPSGTYPFNIVGAKAVIRGSIVLTR